jgi:hypothetical protein
MTSRSRSVMQGGIGARSKDGRLFHAAANGIQVNLPSRGRRQDWIHHRVAGHRDWIDCCRGGIGDCGYQRFQSLQMCDTSGTHSDRSGANLYWTTASSSHSNTTDDAPDAGTAAASVMPQSHPLPFSKRASNCQRESAEDAANLLTSSSPGPSPTPSPLQIRTRRFPPSGSSVDATRVTGPRSEQRSEAAEAGSREVDPRTAPR